MKSRVNESTRGRVAEWEKSGMSDNMAWREGLSPGLLLLMMMLLFGVFSLKSLDLFE